jgi:tyrosyl-tRNA synthetase
MWRYYELLTDLPVADIARMRDRAGSGEANPRDFKVALARRVISDFHSTEAATAAEEEFVRRFRNKEVPDEVEIIEVETESGSLPLARLLAKTGLASSVAEGRRLVEQGGVRIGSVKQSDPNAVLGARSGDEVLIQVGKRRFLKMRVR